MSEKKQLNEEELEKVSGGGKYAPADYLPASHGAHITASELYKHKNMYINKKFYCVHDSSPYHYMVVTLKNVGTIDDVTITAFINMYYSETVYINEIHGGFEIVSGWRVGETHVLSSKLYTFYAME